MEDKRKFIRWNEPKEKSAISCAELEGEVDVLDMSAGGMKILCSRHLEVGTVVYAELRIIPQIKPFFVIGKVTRSTARDNVYDVAIKFDKVSTIKPAA
ncbi:MAG: hypothetical protein B1H08_06130 [Candidatus Omnitrophica bacterium 4484_171]|nr:MAG: hypothetical protein B1H08_06130 [Candidatus Omnitrophica bacterium 4484_171]